jgi:hypothetical protein
MEIKNKETSTTLDWGNKRMKSKGWDVIFIASGMVFGFIVIVMNLTGMWPCNTLDVIQNSNTNSDNGLLVALNGAASWLHQLFRCN